MRQRAVLFGTLASLARQGGAELGSGAEELYSRIGQSHHSPPRELFLATETSAAVLPSADHLRLALPLPPLFPRARNEWDG
eukprot:scaffold2078_cov34-Tisochrysis_lutea.AAC.7